MVTKRATPRKKTSPRKATVTESANLTDRAAMKVLESESTAVNSPMGIDPGVRRQLVESEAYFLAERRGFAAGNELEDWVTAEAVVDSRLQRMRVA